MNNEFTLFQSRRSVAVIPCLTRDPDEYTLIQTTWQNTTGSRIKSGMTKCASPHLKEGVLLIPNSRISKPLSSFGHHPIKLVESIMH